MAAGTDGCKTSTSVVFTGESLDTPVLLVDGGMVLYPGVRFPQLYFSVGLLDDRTLTVLRHIYTENTKIYYLINGSKISTD